MIGIDSSPAMLERARSRAAEADVQLDLREGDMRDLALWWATKNEWLGLIDVAGLEVEALYGGFERRPFDDESREYVFIASRRG